MAALDTSHSYAGKRTSITLSAQDVRDLNVIRQSPSGMADLPQSASKSEAALIHAVFERGLRELREAELDSEYAELAQELQNGSRESRRTRAVTRRRGTAGIQ